MKQPFPARAALVAALALAMGAPAFGGDDTPQLLGRSTFGDDDPGSSTGRSGTGDPDAPGGATARDAP